MIRFVVSAETRSLETFTVFLPTISQYFTIAVIFVTGIDYWICFMSHPFLPRHWYKGSMEVFQTPDKSSNLLCRTESGFYGALFQQAGIRLWEPETSVRSGCAPGF